MMNSLRKNSMALLLVFAANYLIACDHEDESSDNNIEINLSYIFNQNQTKNTGTQISLYPINNKRMLINKWESQ